MKILFNNKCLKYNTGNHIEGVYRVKDFEKKIQNSGNAKKGEEYLKHLYSEEYIENMKKRFQENEYIAEVNTKKTDYEIACIAVDLAVEASIQNAFAITRPPGHHASSDNVEGFCFFNNIAIATQRLLETEEEIKNEKEGKKKICIIDIDGHHGNGTEKIFKDNSNVLYCSLHQENTYPYTGYIDDSHSLNFPLCPGSSDDVFLNVAELFLKAINRFNPDIIGISAGFDGYYKDYLLNLNFTKKGFFSFGELIKKTKKQVFCCLEGGYHNEVFNCTKELINGLSNGEYDSNEDFSKSNEVVFKDFLEKEKTFKETHNLI